MSHLYKAYISTTGLPTDMAGNMSIVEQYIVAERFSAVIGKISIPQNEIHSVKIDHIGEWYIYADSK